MNNSVFWQTMENVRKHVDVRLVTDEKRYLKHVMKPNFKGGARFSENLMGAEMGKIEVKMNKPTYLGQTIFRP